MLLLLNIPLHIENINTFFAIANIKETVLGDCGQALVRYSGPVQAHQRPADKG